MSNSLQNVAVLGAAGRTGHLIVEEALRAGHSVTAMVRSPEKFPPLAAGIDNDAKLSIVGADVRDPETLRTEFVGHDVVVSAIGATGVNPQNLYSDGARAIVTAMESAGVKRLIGITSSGVRPDDPNFAFWFRRLLRPLVKGMYADMALMEQIVRDSTLDWTFVRPSHLQNREPTGTYRVLDNSTPKHGWKIARADLARFIVNEIDEHRWSHRAPSLAE